MLQKLNELSTGVKAVIMLVIAAALAGGGWYLWVSPINDKTTADEATLKAKLAENAELKKYETQTVELDRRIASLRAQMEYQKQIVPDEKEADNFIILLQEQASNAGIQLRKIESKPVSSKEYYTEVPFNIQVDGPFFGMLTFFEKLAGQTRIVNVNDLNMKSTVKGSQYPIGPNDSVSVIATAKTFFSKEVAAAAPVTGPGTPVKK